MPFHVIYHLNVVTAPVLLQLLLMLEQLIGRKRARRKSLCGLSKPTDARICVNSCH